MLLLLRTVETLGSAWGLSRALARWRKPAAVHDPGKIVVDPAIAVVLGGDCLADIGALRAEPRILGLVASDPAVSRMITTLARDAPKALAAIDSAQVAARAVAWTRAGRHAPDHRIDAEHPLTIDLDATLVTAHSDKEHAHRRSNTASASIR